MGNEKIGKKEKVILIVSVVVVLIIVAVVLLMNLRNASTAENEDPMKPDEVGENYIVVDDVKLNRSEEFIKEKKFGKYKVYGAVFQYAQGQSDFSAVVELLEETSGIVQGKPVTLHFVDKDGKEINKLEAYIPDIKDNKKVLIEAGTNRDLVGVYDYYITNKGE